MNIIEDETDLIISAIADNYACYVEDEACKNEIRGIYGELLGVIHKACIKNADIISKFFTTTICIKKIAYDFCEATKDEIIEEFDWIQEKHALDYKEDYKYDKIPFNESIFMDIIMKELEE